METQTDSPFKYTTLKEYTKLEQHVFLRTLIKKTDKKFFQVSKYYDILENFDNETETRKKELVKFVENEPLSLKQKITNILKLN